MNEFWDAFWAGILFFAGMVAHLALAIIFGPIKALGILVFLSLLVLIGLTIWVLIREER